MVVDLVVVDSVVVKPAVVDSLSVGDLVVSIRPGVVVNIVVSL